MRSGSEHWTRMVVVADEEQEKKEEDATHIKPNNPHLAGGEIE